MKYLYPAWIVMAATIGVSCGGGAQESSRFSHTPLLQKIKKLPATSISPPVSSEKHLEGVTRLEAVLEGQPQGFFVADRTGKIEKFPCLQCHLQGSGALKPGQMKKEKKAHWNIHLKHASSDVMSCTTCHRSTNMNELQLLGRKSISFGHSYQLCAQCHSKQAVDWQGGAHGKRLGGWAPPRTVMNCTQCHNPHSPSLEKRWPEPEQMKGVL